MENSWKVTLNPQTKEENIIVGGCYRISVLTESLLRLEYDPEGQFENRATQCVWNRNFPKTFFRYIETEDSLEIFTENLHLIYDKQVFSPNGLSIEVIGNLSAYDSVWHYGDEFETLGGTARTLDTADGAIPLEKGIISKNGFSVMDDSRSLILREDGWVEPRKKGGIDLYFWGYGHHYLEAVRDFYFLCGKTPMIPRYALGNWWSRYYKYSEESYLKLMDDFEEEKVPFSVAVIDMDWHLVDIDPKYGSGWTGYTWNPKLFSDPQRFLQELHRRNMHVTLNVHPANGVQAHEEMYPEIAKEMGVNIEEEQPVNFDVSDPHFMEAYFKYLHHPNEERGVDFWWIDWQSGGISKVEGLDPLWMLNHYHFLDNGRDGKRPMTFSRYAGPGSHRYPVGFSGDTIVTWASLAFQPYFTATASNIGYGLWSHDIGGHMNGIKDDEMAGRWLQLGVFSPITRLHSTNNEFNGKEPWRYQKEIREMMDEFLRLRHQLLPYLYTMLYRNYKQGIPMVLPMYYSYPEEDYAYQIPNQYEFGSELIACPITTPRIKGINMACQKVWIPEGIYFDFFIGRKYRGGRMINMYRDIQSFPVLAKAGAIIPMMEENQDVNKNPQSLTIHIFPLADGNFALYEDDNLTQAYLSGDAIVTRMKFTWGTNAEFCIEKPEGNLSLLPDRRNYTLKFHKLEACEPIVYINGQGQSVSADYCQKRQTLSIDLADVSVDSEIRICLPEVKCAENDIITESFDFLNQAEILFDLKDLLYRKICVAKERTLLLSELLTMGLDSDLLGVLTEIITA